jgi:hypothetical protein
MKRKPKTPPQEVTGLFPLAIIHVEALLERIHNHKLKTFESSLINQLSKLTPKELKVLNHYYQHSYDDMKLALGGDEFVLEAYSNYDKNQMKVALAMYKALRSLKHDDAVKGRFGNHGPRKHKVKPPELVVKKLLYLVKDHETGFSSIDPKDLVGAAEMWVYNTKTRKLGCYYAKNKNGLTVKGTTILNYDEKTSTTKTLRKPKLQLTEFFSKDMNKYWNAIRAVPQEISPRLIRETLILRVLDTSACT